MAQRHLWLSLLSRLRVCLDIQATSELRKRALGSIIPRRDAKLQLPPPPERLVQGLTIRPPEGPVAMGYRLHHFHAVVMTAVGNEPTAVGERKRKSTTC